MKRTAAPDKGQDSNPLVEAAPAPPPLMQKQYILPDGCSVTSFVMRELTTRDELTVAMAVDMARTDMQEGISILTLDKIESIRLALVQVDEQPVNAGGIPYVAMDHWNSRTMSFARVAFEELNAFAPDEVEAFKAGAAVWGAQPSPNE